MKNVLLMMQLPANYCCILTLKCQLIWKGNRIEMIQATCSCFIRLLSQCNNYVPKKKKKHFVVKFMP